MRQPVPLHARPQYSREGAPGELRDARDRVVIVRTSRKPRDYNERASKVQAERARYNRNTAGSLLLSGGASGGCTSGTGAGNNSLGSARIGSLSSGGGASGTGTGTGSGAGGETAPIR